MLRLHRPPETTPFRAGARLYSVRIAEDPIVFEGCECEGFIDAKTLEILIAGDVPPNLRLQILLHELTHASIFAFGKPIGVEATCDFVASVAELAYHDLAACGGEEALLALKPGEQLQRLEPAAAAVA